MARTFDLIWCGSLVTHLNAPAILSLFRLFDRHLASNGVVIFTAHGDYVRHRLETTTNWPYQISREAGKTAVSSYRTEGFVFVPYIGKTEADQYGLSLTSPAWIRSQCALIQNWKELFHEPRGWDQHQDVFGYLKASR